MVSKQTKQPKTTITPGGDARHMSQADARSLWQQEMVQAKAPVRYDKTSALLLGWEPNSDDFGVAEELARLEKTMQDKYHFDVQTKLMNCETHPQEQAFQHLANFVSAQRQPHTLLIIYYAGHGYSSALRDGRIALSGTQLVDPTDQLTRSIEWDEVERTLSTTRSDVLVIFDCCQAGLLCRSAQEGLLNPNRSFQYLGACESIQVTERAGPRSFTSAMIWALEKLAMEPGFPVTKLVKTIEQHEHFPKKQKPVLFGGRFDPVAENIWIAPMRTVDGEPDQPKTFDERTAGPAAKSTRGVMELRLHFENGVTEEDIINSARVLTDCMRKNKLRCNDVSFIDKYSLDTTDIVRRAAWEWKQVVRTPAQQVPPGSSKASRVDSVGDPTQALPQWHQSQVDERHEFAEKPAAQLDNSAQAGIKDGLEVLKSPGTRLAQPSETYEDSRHDQHRAGLFGDRPIAIMDYVRFAPMRALSSVISLFNSARTSLVTAATDESRAKYNLESSHHSHVDGSFLDSEQDIDSIHVTASSPATMAFPGDSRYPLGSRRLLLVPDIGTSEGVHPDDAVRSRAGSSTDDSDHDNDGAQISAKNEYSKLHSSMIESAAYTTTTPNEKEAFVGPENEADTESVTTDGREHSFPQDTKHLLVVSFAQHIVEKLVPEGVQTLFDHDGALDIIEDLIRDFSILLDASVLGDVIRKQAVTFVRHRRRPIAIEIATSLCAWRPGADDQVSWKARMAMLPFGDTRPADYEDFELESIAPSNAWAHEDITDEMHQSYNDTSPLRDVKLAEKFLLDSQEFQWLIGSIRRLLSLDQTGTTCSEVRGWVAKSLKSVGKNFAFTLDWPVCQIVREQHPGNDVSVGCLSNMIVYSGTASMCYGATALDYVRHVWPAVGPHTLDCFDQALVHAAHEASATFDNVRLHTEYRDESTHVSITVTEENCDARSRMQILEIVEVCIWLAVACRANRGESWVGLGIPKLVSSYERLSVVVRLEPIPSSTPPEGRCWTGMVHNPVIAEGYPIPKRDDPLRQRGLELSIGLMAALSHADWATIFGNTLLLKGAISALVPVVHTSTSTTWHFKINKDLQRMTYQQATNDSANLPFLTYSDLEDQRHFVGLWTPDARIIAGSEQSSSYSVHPSRSEPVNHKTLSLATLSINGGKLLTVGTTFNVGHKDVAPALKSSEAQVYELQIDAASKMTVLFYSTEDRRAWLLDGASALVHLARVWLASTSAVRLSMEKIEGLQYIRGHGGGSSAVAVLMANKDFKIFEDSEVKHEATTPDSPSDAGNSAADSGYLSGISRTSSNTTSEGSTKRTTTWWTYKALIVELWRNLEAMKDKLDKLKMQGPEVSFRMPSTGEILTGWDTVDFLSPRRPLQARFVGLKSESRRWIKFTKEISAIPLMAQGFGDLIAPSTELHVCKSMQFLPKERDLLAVPLSVLLLTAKRYLRWENENSRECVRISDSTFMYGFHPVAKDCRCASGILCKAVSDLGSRAKREPDTQLSRYEQTLFDSYPHAAVVLGSPANFLGRILQSENSRGRGPKSTMSRDGLQLTVPTTEARATAGFQAEEEEASSRTCEDEEEDGYSSAESEYFSSSE